MNAQKESTSLEEAFIHELISMLSFDSFSDEGKYALYSLTKDQKYEKLSSRRLAKITHVSFSTFNRMRNGDLIIENPGEKDAVKPITDNKRGRPRILTEEDEEHVIDQAKQKRSQAKAVTLKWATQICNDRLSTAGKKVSRFTVRRVLKKKGWRRRKSMRKQGYCLTNYYNNIIRNWKHQMKVFFENHIGCTVHIMDESGIYTNLYPRYTFVSPDDKYANVDAHPDTTKDTVVVTTSSNGNGSLFYVPFRRATRDKKGCSGVGTSEMKQWLIHFLSFAQRGDVLIMDNLMAHHDATIRATLERHGIIVKFFPIRGAAILSPLDNCFFAILKYHLEERFQELIGLSGINLREKKLDIIKEVFDELINKHVGLSYFRHCGHDKMSLELGNQCNTIHAQIPFVEDEDNENEDYEEDQNQFSFAEPKSIDFPRVITKNIALPFAKVLLGFLYVNKSYRAAIENSTDPLMKRLSLAFKNADNQKTFSANTFFSSDTADLHTLKDYISYIHTVTNNILHITNVETSSEDIKEYLSITDDELMGCLISKNIVAQCPDLITIFIDKNGETNPDFKFKENIFCVSDNGRVFYELIGFIGYKDNDSTYITVSKLSENKWIKMDRSWEFFDKNNLQDYYIDIGFGHGIVLFYKRVIDGRTAILLDILNSNEDSDRALDER